MEANEHPKSEPPIKREHSPDSTAHPLNINHTQPNIGELMEIDLKEEDHLMVSGQDNDKESLLLTEHPSRSNTHLSHASTSPTHSSHADSCSTRSSVKREPEASSANTSPAPDPEGYGDDHKVLPSTKVESEPQAKVRKSRRSPVKNVAEYAARLSFERKLGFKKYVEANMHKVQRSGFISPPPPKRRGGQRLKQNGDVGEASAPEPKPVAQSAEEQRLVFVKKKDREKQIAKCTNSIGNNRHGDTQKKDIKDGSKVFGRGQVQCFERGTERFYQLKGMKGMLKEYQLPVVAWCALQEHSDIGPQGGIIADEPGFGKTIEILAAIYGNPPSQTQRHNGEGATLIVVHNGVLAKQWHDEILNHLGRDYHANSHIFSGRKSGNITSYQLSKRWIVITTYHELNTSYYGIGLQASTNDADGSKDSYDQGKLHGINFYRLIIDEVHNIKYHEGITSLAACAIRAQHKWGLSGTPLSNAVEELYAYTKFIGGMAANSFADFQKFYMDPKDGKQRVDVLITNYSYRRTDEDLFLGNKMMNLPQKHMVDQNITLTAVERVIQRWLDDIFGNSEVKTASEPCAGSMRYRQLLSHPYALEAFLRDDGEYGVSIEQLEALLEAVSEVEQPIPQPAIGQIGSWAQRQVSDDPSLRVLGEPKPPISFGASAFGVRCFRFATLLELTIANHKVREANCGICNNNISSPSVAEVCGHYFCGPCVRTLPKPPDGTYRCPSCHVDTRLAPLPTLTSVEGEFDEMEKAKDVQQSTSKKRKRSRRPKVSRRGGRATAQVSEPEPEPPRERRLGEDARGMRPPLKHCESAFMKVASMENRGIPLAGSKLTAVKDTLLRWQRAHPDEKCIIFVQFIKSLLMTGVMLNLEGIDFVYTFGNMSKDRKSDAKTTFETDPNVKVLVATMGTCSEGLNLTCANRVIVVDAWWNNAREKQSFGRVVRTGQTKETYCVRMKALDSVDDKIEEIQVNKSEEVDFVVQDDGHKPFALSELGVLNLLNPEKYLELCIETVSEIRGLDTSCPGEANAPDAIEGSSECGYESDSLFTDDQQDTDEADSDSDYVDGQ